METLITTTPNSIRTTEAIIDILKPYRRLIDDDPSTEDHCLAIASERIDRFIMNGLPIHFVLPAFPCKSCSQRKVLGELPDMAEEQSLGFLHQICETVKQIHPPGARITICSDGRVFGPIVRVSDEAISAYSSELRNMVRQRGFSAIDFFSLEDIFEGDAETIRARLLEQFGKSIEELRDRASHDPSAMNTFLGIAKFMYEEGLAWNEQQGFKQSNKQVERDAKQRAWKVIQASQAWSTLTDTIQFPDAVRLSIHPQSSNSPKFGIRLLPTRDNFLTPWHGVAVLKETQVRLVRRSELASMTGKIVIRNGRPSHFQEA